MSTDFVWSSSGVASPGAAGGAAALSLAPMSCSMPDMGTAGAGVMLALAEFGLKHESRYGNTVKLA